MDHFIVSRIAPQWELDLEDVITGLHHLQDTLNFLLFLFNRDSGLHVVDQLVFDHLAGPVEEVLHHIEKPGVSMVRDILEPVWDLVPGVCTAGDVHGGRRDPEQCIDSIILDTIF